MGGTCSNARDADLEAEREARRIRYMGRRSRFDASRHKKGTRLDDRRSGSADEGAAKSERRRDDRHSHRENSRTKRSRRHDDDPDGAAIADPTQRSDVRRSGASDRNPQDQLTKREQFARTRVSPIELPRVALRRKSKSKDGTASSVASRSPQSRRSPPVVSEERVAAAAGSGSVRPGGSEEGAAVSSRSLSPIPAASDLVGLDPASAIATVLQAPLSARPASLSSTGSSNRSPSSQHHQQQTTGGTTTTATSAAAGSDRRKKARSPRLVVCAADVLSPAMHKRGSATPSPAPRNPTTQPHEEPQQPPQQHQPWRGAAESAFPPASGHAGGASEESSAVASLEVDDGSYTPVDTDGAVVWAAPSASATVGGAASPASSSNRRWHLVGFLAVVAAISVSAGFRVFAEHSLLRAEEHRRAAAEAEVAALREQLVSVTKQREAVLQETLTPSSTKQLPDDVDPARQTTSSSGDGDEEEEEEEEATADVMCHDDRDDDHEGSHIGEESMQTRGGDNEDVVDDDDDDDADLDDDRSVKVDHLRHPNVHRGFLGAPLMDVVATPPMVITVALLVAFGVIIAVWRCSLPPSADGGTARRLFSSKTPEATKAAERETPPTQPRPSAVRLPRGAQDEGSSADVGASKATTKRPSITPDGLRRSLAFSPPSQ